MIWLTWRQFRVQALVVYTAVVGYLVVLAISGPGLPRLDQVSASVYDQLTSTDRKIYYAGLFLVALVPAVIGAFWGAPMVARELEAGTHRLVWNQTISRNRWLGIKLGITAITAALITGALALAVSRWASSLDGSQSNGRGSLPGRLTPIAFAMRGIVPIGYAVFALALGVTAGAVLRRVVPAMAVTLAVFAVVQIVVPQLVRPHLLPPSELVAKITGANLTGIEMPGPGQPVKLSIKTGNRGDWILSNRTIDASGGDVSELPSSVSDCLAARTAPISASGAPVPSGRAQAPSANPCLAMLANLGYRQRLSYQPANRFWLLQWVETALFLALSALLTWFCFWWTRRRLS